MVHPLIHELTDLFTAHANAHHAHRQHKYLRCKFDFFGIAQPQRAALQKIAFKNHPITTITELTAVIKSLWDTDRREYFYAAMDLVYMYKTLWNHNTLTLFKKCIVHHSWWDTIDDLASNCVGTLCMQYPELMSIIDTWIDNENVWLRRTALIFQLKYKHKTDTQRLFTYCQKRMHEKEFFIRKAIGWALREYSKTNPSAVAQFVTKHCQSLSSLSVREASKYLNDTVD